MYRDFYNLRLKPFQISTDPRFLWLGEKHQEALAVLKYGIMDNKGFLLLTGDVGTGKTTLLNALVDSLDDDVLVAMVTDPGLAKMDFFNFIADSFGLNIRFKSKGEFLIFLKNYLLDLNQRNKQALLIIDECQHLNQKLLEEVRLLSNIEKTNTKLINIFFVGQSEFNNNILRPQNRAIRQRITINYNITALSEAETEDYIRFRLGVAGSDDPVFTSGAIQEIHQFSNGYPRLINIICDQALLTGFVKERRQIDAKIVAECADELRIAHGTAIEDSDATPEARSEKLEARSETKAVEPRENNPLSTLYQQLRRKSPLAVALVILVTIWAVLVTTFIFSQQYSGVTNNAMDRKAAADTISNAQAAPEQLNPAPRVQPNGENQAAEVPVSTLDRQEEDVKSRSLPKADTGTATEASNEIARVHTSTATEIREEARLPISLADIHRNYGLYPEVHFEFNSNSLDDVGYQVLGAISRYCLQNPETIIILRGYTDSSGVLAYNLKLSEFRADVVKTYLVGRGIKEETITTIAMGPVTEGPGGTTVPLTGERRKVVIEIIGPNG